MFEAALALAMLFFPTVEDGIALSLVKLQPTHYEESIESITVSEEILSAAKEMLARKIDYRFSYPSIDYPLGDVSSDWGLCCDVIVRACRAAGIDLQELVYDDSLSERQRYVDANRSHRFSRPLNRSWIHRRTSNLNLFFNRHAKNLPLAYNYQTADTWQPGDIVIYKKNSRLTWHIAIVSDTVHPSNGEPMVIDAWMKPGYVSESHLLTEHGTIGGHYRLTDEFRDSLSDSHRFGAVLAWKKFMGVDSRESDQRLAESSEEKESSPL